METLVHASKVKKIRESKQPSATALYLETGMAPNGKKFFGNNNLTYSTTAYFNARPTFRPGSSTCKISFPHNRVINAGMLDGHVEAFRYPGHNRLLPIAHQNTDDYTTYMTYR